METFNLTTLLIALVAGVLIFIALREVNCWYWKINKRIELQEKTNYLLERLLANNEKKNANGKETNTEQTSVNDPKVVEEMLKQYRNKGQ